MQGLDTLLPKTNGYKSRRLWYPIHGITKIRQIKLQINNKKSPCKIIIVLALKYF